MEISDDHFNAAATGRFRERLRANLTALEIVLARPDFGRGSRTLGVVLELFLVDQQARPLPISADVVRAAHTSLITPEMGTFDIELATPPVGLAGRPFAELRAKILETMDLIQTQAAARGARIVPIGILPTLRPGDFTAAAITDLPRYRALAAGLRALRRVPLEIRIDGDDPLELTTEEPAMHAANAAFQVHLRAAPDEFANLFNAVMMLTGPVLAAAANSPTFLGHSLWHETRVALFKQAGDDRPARPVGSDDHWHHPSRIGFGNGWVRDGALELFAESVALHAPLLPVCDDEDAVACAVAGGVPALQELRLHHGTVWKWNRPVYDPLNGGHLRIELRALPSGPTVDDMLANAAFMVGGTLALAQDLPRLLASFPFALAENNFYRAAQHGLQAELAWPTGAGESPTVMRAQDLLTMLLPRAEEGLVIGGVDPTEARKYLGIFEARVRAGVTGAVWQRTRLAQLRDAGMPLPSALRELLERYMVHAESGLPVHAWPLDLQPAGTGPRTANRGAALPS